MNSTNQFQRRWAVWRDCDLLTLVLLSCFSVQLISAQTDAWGLVPLDALNTAGDEVLIGWDGQTIYFSRSDRFNESKGNRAWFQREKTDWEAHRVKGWSTFEAPNSLVLRAFSSANWPGFETVQHVAIDEERGVLVLSAAESGDDFDLYMAQESANGWGMLQALKELNTEGDEVYPNFQDGILLFASNGRENGRGGFDVFQSLREDHYQTAKPLPPPLNSAGDELAAVPAGRGGDSGFYLSAARMSGSGIDLWWVGPDASGFLDTPENQTEFAMEFRFQRAAMQGLNVDIQERGGQHVFSGQSDANGRVSIGNIRLDAAMSVQVMQRNATSPIPDGAVCHVFERCPSGECTDEYWTGWRRIRSYRMEGGAAFVFDLLPLDALGRWPRPHDGDASQLEVEAANWQGRFEKSRFELAENDQYELTKWLNQAKNATGNWPQDWKLEITGYTDASGSDDQNLNLSRERAEHAKELVVLSGFDSARIVCIGRGSEGSTSISQSDRRVELRWVLVH
jgi:outer membrane protein OmpA-like peptidoglycan-associated protein